MKDVNMSQQKRNSFNGDWGRTRYGDTKESKRIRYTP